MSEQLPSKILDELDDEYLSIINPIITNEEFIRRKTFNHHEHRSVYGHSLMVSVKSYHLAKKLGLDYKTCLTLSAQTALGLELEPQLPAWIFLSPWHTASFIGSMSHW